MIVDVYNVNIDIVNKVVQSLRSILTSMRLHRKVAERRVCDFKRNSMTLIRDARMAIDKIRNTSNRNLISKSAARAMLINDERATRFIL